MVLVATMAMMEMMSSMVIPKIVQRLVTILCLVDPARITSPVMRVTTFCMEALIMIHYLAGVVMIS